MINRETPLAKIAGQMSLSMKLQTFQPNPGSSSVYSGDAPMSYPEHRLKEHRRAQEGTGGHRRAQKDTGIRKHCPASGGRACSGPDACHQLE